MLSRPFEILLVEDTPGDVWLTREVLLQGPAAKRISVVTDGEKALDFLHHRGKYADAPRPDLILLDINLPRVSGLEVLTEIKRDPALRAITVIVLTTSEAFSDVNSAYDLNANCYVVKPVDLEKFTDALRGIEHFWMSMARLPTTVPPTEEDVEKSASVSPAGEGTGSQAAEARYAERHARIPLRRRRRIVGVGAGSRRGRDSRFTRYRHR